MKKTASISLALSIAFFILPVIVFAAATLSVSNNLPGLSSNPTNPGSWINGFYNLALMAGGILAFGAIVYGGVLYAASAGNSSRQSEGKEYIWAAITGLLLLAGAWIVLHTVNGSLTNISFPTLSSLSNVGSAPGTGNGSGNGGGGTSIGSVFAASGVSGALNGLNDDTMTALNDLESGCTQQSGGTCSVYVTSGTGGTHAAGACDHADGCKADIAPNAAVNNYITSLPRANPPTRSDGAPLYQAPDGSIYADERSRPPNCGSNCQWTGAHWDMAAHS